MHWHALRTLIRAIVYNFRKAEARATKVRQGVHGLRGGRRAAVARVQRGAPVRLSGQCVCAD